MFNEPFFPAILWAGYITGHKIPRSQREDSLGSGVIVSRTLHLTTHAEEHRPSEVTRSNKRQLQARLLAPTQDGHRRRIESGGSAIPRSPGDSSEVQVGDYALARRRSLRRRTDRHDGNCQRHESRNLGIEDYEDFIQTDARSTQAIPAARW